MKIKHWLLVLLFLIASVGVVWAQDSVAQAEADYRFQFDQYRSAYQQYQVDKAEFEDSGTLTSEREALDSAKEASVARADVLRTYTQWLRLWLLQYEAVYQPASEISTRLNELNSWYQDHEAQIAGAGTIETFTEVQDEYATDRETRERLYLQAQIELKLARLSVLKNELVRLHVELRPVLESRPTTLEIEQGLSRADANIESLNKGIEALSEYAKILEVTPQPGQRVSSRDAVTRKATTDLESMRSLILNTITLLSELETRYGQ